MKNSIKKELIKLIPKSNIESIHGQYYMRFEMGGEGNDDKINRVNQATKRGTEIYEQLMGYGEIIIVIEEWANELFDLGKRNKDYLYHVLNSNDLTKIGGPFEQIYYEEDGKGNRIEKIFEDKKDCDLVIGKVSLSNEQVEKIIKGIASFEMGLIPSVPQNVFFFNPTRQTGFRIYDDRGCDIWANSIEELRPIYNDFNSWILDYNRTEIDEMFKKKTA